MWRATSMTKQRVTQNERHDSRAGNETLFEEEDPEMNMRQILNDPESFKEKFCSRLTTRNLPDIQLDKLSIEQGSMELPTRGINAGILT